MTAIVWDNTYPIDARSERRQVDHYLIRPSAEVLELGWGLPPSSVTLVERLPTQPEK